MLYHTPAVKSLHDQYVTFLSYSGLSVEWAENNQKKKIINVPHDVYELGCIQDVEDGLKVSTASDRQFIMTNESGMCLVNIYTCMYLLNPYV